MGRPTAVMIVAAVVVVIHHIVMITTTVETIIIRLVVCPIFEINVHRRAVAITTRHTVAVGGHSCYRERIVTVDIRYLVAVMVIVFLPFRAFGTFVVSDVVVGGGGILPVHNMFLVHINPLVNKLLQQTRHVESNCVTLWKGYYTSLNDAIEKERRDSRLRIEYEKLLFLEPIFSTSSS